jgi:hypothetical protein
MIVAALLGTVILTDVTQVSGRVSAEPGESTPRNPSTGAPMLLISRVAMTSGRTDMSGAAAAQMARPLENHALPGRLLVLTGIIAYTDPRQGFAIIGSSVNNTYLARPGQQLPDGSSLREIYPKHVVLEYGGRLETVGMYERGEPSGTAYAQIPPPPQQAIPSQAPRPTDEPPSDRRPGDTRASETTSNERRYYDTQSTDAPQEQAQPEVPLPAAQDPADELSDDRRQRASSRRK